MQLLSSGEWMFSQITGILKKKKKGTGIPVYSQTQSLLKAPSLWYPTIKFYVTNFQDFKNIHICIQYKDFNVFEKTCNIKHRKVYVYYIYYTNCKIKLILENVFF